MQIVRASEKGNDRSVLAIGREGFEGRPVGRELDPVSRIRGVVLPAFLRGIQVSVQRIFPAPAVLPAILGRQVAEAENRAVLAIDEEPVRRRVGRKSDRAQETGADVGRLTFILHPEPAVVPLVQRNRAFHPDRLAIGQIAQPCAAGRAFGSDVQMFAQGIVFGSDRPQAEPILRHGRRSGGDGRIVLQDPDGSDGADQRFQIVPGNRPGRNDKELAFRRQIRLKYALIVSIRGRRRREGFLSALVIQHDHIRAVRQDEPPVGILHRGPGSIRNLNAQNAVLGHQGWPLQGSRPGLGGFGCSFGGSFSRGGRRIFGQRTGGKHGDQDNGQDQ